MANQHISSLEERLSNSNQDCSSTRGLLYESETALQNELQSRMACQRHLRLEQHRYTECDGAYRTACQELRKVKSEIEAMFTFNEMLRQEIEHGQNIIESMATKISNYESTASKVIESLKGSWGGTEQDEALRFPESRSELRSPSYYTLADVPSPSPQPKSEPGSPGSPSINELPQSPLTKQKSQKRPAGSEQDVQQRKVKKPRRSRATSRAQEADIDT